nr:beta-galactosidase [Armatimonadota bacterium]
PKVLFHLEKSLTLDAGDQMGVTASWQPEHGTGDCEVLTQLLSAGQVMDQIRHDITFLSAAAPPPNDFVTVHGSDFILHGQQWNPVGVNFWPLSSSGLEPGDYRNHWLAHGFYDPDEVDRDLDRVKALGMNMVSIQMGGVENIRNTLDFLRRCDRHGLKVNGFLNGASPLDFNEKEAGDIIRAGHLDRNSTLFAYDTIWEPGNSVFDAQHRPRWDADWAGWIAERYGSIENAEADWGMPVPRTDGKITSPSDQQLREQGPWRVMVAAYRRFMDDLISRKWNDATRRLRALDPNHLISFRQGNTLPQDFAFTGPVKHIDFISPEGYSIPSSEAGYNAAAFTIRYLHFTTGGKPIFWAEFGRSVWDNETMGPAPAAMPGQASYIELFNRASLDAGANGLAPWWWPGGYRVDERSDFGIMNPDGTPRPAADIISRYAARLEAPRPYPAPDTWLTVDRDAHPGGYWWTIFHEGAEAYARAHAAGQNLGVRTAGTGATSTNTPLVAVGNTPLNGHNPPKYLNAEFNWLQVQDRTGKWVDVEDGAQIPVAAGKPVRLRASVGNTQEAEWIAPNGHEARPGAVFLSTPEGAALPFSQPIPKDTPYLGDADFGEFQLPALPTRTPLTLQMHATGRAWFGEKREFWLVPGGWREEWDDGRESGRAGERGAGEREKD